jgi:glycosyltransferase involved in cell wall biosynthesis
MPTRDRRAFILQALCYFLRQDYEHSELVIVDDGTDAVRDLVPSDPRIRYRRLDEPLVLGEKRNLACELARGSIIVHWDDDDWSAPYRLSYQVEELGSRAGICGNRRELFYDVARRRAWLFEFPPRRRHRLIGNTLCYRKDVWARRPFAPLAIGEDARFVRAAGPGTALALGDLSMCVGLVHPHNTSRKSLGEPGWRAHPRAEVELLFGSDLALYADFGRLG